MCSRPYDRKTAICELCMADMPGHHIDVGKVGKVLKIANCVSYQIGMHYASLDYLLFLMNVKNNLLFKIKQHVFV